MKERERIREKTCPICHKRFIPATYHSYTVRRMLVCSWACVLKGEGKQEKKVLQYHTGYEKPIQHNKYAVMARRDDADEWTNWADVDDYDRAVHHLNHCQELGFKAKIVERKDI